MCVSADGAACTNFVAFAAAASYAFTADGKHAINVRFRDAYGLVSEPATASITIDTAAPVGGALAAVAMPNANNLSWTTAGDAGSGFAGYKLVGAPGASPPANCTTGTALYARSAREGGVVLIGRQVRDYEDMIYDALPRGAVPAGTADGRIGRRTPLLLSRGAV